jgi:hypothetical protein
MRLCVSLFLLARVHERSDGISGGFCLEGGSGDGFFGKGGSDAVLGEQGEAAA